MVKRWFLDTEFMEEPGWMELLSIAIVSEDGQENFYAINREANITRANEWVRRNVLPRLFREWDQYAITKDQIAKEVLELIPPKPEGDAANWQKPEFWTYFGDYDWVNFCWIFGKMVELPNGYPMYALDLKQVSYLHNPPLMFQKQDQNQEHHALNDACWNREQYLLLKANGAFIGANQD